MAMNVSLTTNTGGKRDSHLEQHLHHAEPHAWQCRPDYGSEESVGSLQGWIRRLADSGIDADHYHWHHSWQQELRVSNRKAISLDVY